MITKAINLTKTSKALKGAKKRKAIIAKDIKWAKGKAIAAKAIK